MKKQVIAISREFVDAWESENCIRLSKMLLFGLQVLMSCTVERRCAVIKSSSFVSFSKAS